MKDVEYYINHLIDLPFQSCKYKDNSAQVLMNMEWIFCIGFEINKCRKLFDESLIISTLCLKVWMNIISLICKFERGNLNSENM